jgi:PAS domain S-box-containing protein
MSNEQPSREDRLRLHDAATKSLEFRASQVRQLYVYSRTGTMGALLGVIVVALAAREYIPHIRLIAWVAAYLAIQGPRYHLVRIFPDRCRSDEDIIQWGRKFSLLTFFSGLAWGATATLIFPAGFAPQQMLIVIALAGISAAATVVYSPLKECYAPTVVAILAPLSLRYFYEGGEANTFVGTYVLLFGGVLLIAGRLMHRFVINSLKLQFDKTELLRSLTEQKRVSDTLNQELIAEIKARTQMEQDLRVQTERFQMLSDSAPFGMVVIGKGGTFEYLNPKFKETVGYDLQDVPNGRDWIRKAYPDSAYRHEVVSAWKDVFETLPPGTAISRVFTVRCKDGSHKIISFRPVKLRTGEDLMTCEDITDRTRSEEEIEKSRAALRESEERYRAVFDNAGIGIDLLGRDGRFLQVNNALRNMLGYSDREFRQLRLSDITHPDDREISAQRLESIMRGEISTYRLEKRYVKKDGSAMWGDLSVSAIRNGNGEHIATLGVVADITDRKEAEEKLRQEKAISDSTIDSLPGTFYVFDDELRFVRWNKNLEKVTGYSGDEISTMSPLDFFAKDTKAQLHAAIENIITDGAFSIEAVVVAKDGTEIPYWFNNKLLKLHENQHILGLGTDLTERKLAENALKASLKEKEILLREIHHRVKNNLQLISSLLRLHLRQIKRKDQDLAAIFEDIQGRIKAMALAHEALYESENLELVDADLYIQRIVANLRVSYPVSRKQLRVKTDVESITFSINVALPCGLIVNELVTNSLKHAFPEDREGEVVVALVSTGEAEFQLTVRDNGVGMPQHIDLQHPESLGLELVTDLAKQLNGTVEFTGGDGTEFHVRFKGPISHNDQNTR